MFYYLISGISSESHLQEPYQQDVIKLQTMSQKCPNGYFHCNQTLQCIAQKKNCDGEPDCDDGWDELNCDDESDTLFWDHFFRKNPAAQTDDHPNKDCFWNNLDVKLPCLCRRNEFHCIMKKLHKIPAGLPLKGISLL